VGERGCYGVEGPTVISFSGGRTSGFLLRQVLDAHGGKLPPDAAVLFQNTGKEREETLVFIDECSQRWGVPITWLEWQAEDPKYRVVNFETASRNGEPFAKLIEKRQYLPNPVTRFCTGDLKVKVARRYIKAELGWDDWQSFVGIRFDEPRRWKIEGRSSRFKKEDLSLPLKAARITERDVLEFWKRQPFDLGLKSYEGNCDLCFLKGRGKRLRIMADEPGRAEWWIKMEARTGQPFRREGSYSTLADIARRQLALPIVGEDPTDLGECLCHD